MKKPKIRPSTLSIQKVIGPEGVRRVLDKTKGHCTWCGGIMKNVSIDHRVPTSKGGTDDESNLVPCCGSCNSAKSNRSLEYFHRYRCLRKAGFPTWISVRAMDWLIENDLTSFQYEPYQWDS